MPASPTLSSGDDRALPPYGHYRRDIPRRKLFCFVQSWQSSTCSGKAIISTPYLHAIELLDEERGALVAFDGPDAIAAKTAELLDNGTARHAMRKRAYLYARDMVWSRVAQKYMKTFECIYNERLRNPRVAFLARTAEKSLDRLPPVNLDHLYCMNGATGIVEHAVFVIPNYPEGYSTDDNARALIVPILLEELGAGALKTQPSWPLTIWHFSGLCLTQTRNASETASVMNANGRSHAVRKTAMVEFCGD
jgi:hypothetical protein